MRARAFVTFTVASRAADARLRSLVANVCSNGSALREDRTMPATTNDAVIDPFAILVGKKLLLPSDKTKYVAVQMGFLVDMLLPQVARIYVDEKWYLDCNPDVCNAIRDGAVKDGREHFATRGFYEHRRPYEITVDESWYLDQYEDVRSAVHAAVFVSGQAHFEALGYREGRLPFAGFRLARENSLHDDRGMI
jgi:hypothetical protein